MKGTAVLNSHILNFEFQLVVGSKIDKRSNFIIPDRRIQIVREHDRSGGEDEFRDKAVLRSEAAAAHGQIGMKEA